MRIGLDLFTRFRLAQAAAAPSARVFGWRRAGELASGFGAKPILSAPALWAAFKSNLAAEQDRWFPWIVIAFAAGDGIYFGLASEPAAWTAIALAVMAAALIVMGVRTSRSGVRLACALIAAIGLGFAAATLRTDTVAAPVISREMGPLTIAGRVETVSDLGDGQRIWLVPSRIGRDSRDPLPHRLRLTLRAGKTTRILEPGQWISLVAILRPPPEPNIPGGYDFARRAFFDGIGGVGFAFGGAKLVAPERPETLWEELTARIEGMRHNMTKRVRAALPGANGAIAAALITGDRGAIEKDDNAAFRDSGLMHVLSISGLHMALAGLGIFWALRALLALWPRLALTQPIKKWAAVAAVAASGFYLLISGGGAPPVRSFIMLAMMLLGVLVDRPALSMQPVALAGLLILAVSPESIFDPGFQMSFAAIVGLIALAEWHRLRPNPEAGLYRRMWSIGGISRAVKIYVLGVVLTTTVATFATAPFAIFHFDRAVGYAILANVLALPLVGMVVMPAAALAVILMPFDLDYWPLQVMGWGVQRMSEVAHWVGGLPGAVMLVPAWPLTALLFVVAGGLWIGVWRRRWRWLGLVPAAAGVALGMIAVPPDLIVTRDASMAAVRGAGGTLTLMGSHPDEYIAQQWLQRAGDHRDWQAAIGGVCDDLGCVGKSRDGRLVALALRAGALADDCARADVLVSAVPVRQECPHPRLIVDRLQLAREGAVALWLGEGTARLETVAETRGNRPWTTQYRRTRPTRRP